MKIPCTSCGAEVQFKSRVSVFSVCPYCKSMLVRHDINLDILGKMAELPEDMSPLQIGTRGQFKKQGFELIGRLRIGWKDGFWNEWYAYFDNGKEGWLAEAQGFYMMSFPDLETHSIPAASKLAPGQSLTLRGQSFQVDDIKDVTCVGSEGELPIQAPKGRTSISVDLRGGSQAFASIDYSEKDGVRLYLGSYQEFEEFHFSNLRDLGDW